MEEVRSDFWDCLAKLPRPARERIAKYHASRPVWAYLEARRQGGGGGEVEESWMHYGRALDAFAALGEDDRVILREAEEAFGWHLESMCATPPTPNAKRALEFLIFPRCFEVEIPKYCKLQAKLLHGSRARICAAGKAP